MYMCMCIHVHITCIRYIRSPSFQDEDAVDESDPKLVALQASLLSEFSTAKEGEAGSGGAGGLAGGAVGGLGVGTAAAGRSLIDQQKMQQWQASNRGAVAGELNRGKYLGL